MHQRTTLEYEFLLGKAALKSKEHKLAILALKKVPEISPRFYNAHFLLGKAYLNIGKLNKASNEFMLIMQGSENISLRKASNRYLRTINNI